jgi:hypothetical protein
MFLTADRSDFGVAHTTQRLDVYGDGFWPPQGRFPPIRLRRSTGNPHEAPWFTTDPRTPVVGEVNTDAPLHTPHALSSRFLSLLRGAETTVEENTPGTGFYTQIS